MDDLLHMTTCPFYLWLIPYPLRESSKTTHQVNSSPLTGVLHESRGLRPHHINQHSPPKVQQPSRSKGYWREYLSISPKSRWRPSTPRWRPSAPLERLTPFYYSRWPSHQTLIRPYLLQESSETPHQTNTSSCIGVLSESWEWSPHGVAQHHAQAGHYLPDEEIGRASCRERV